MSEEWKTRQSLLIRAKDPTDEEAWAEFVKYYEKFIFHLLHRLNINADDFNDLVQEVLIKLWKSLKNGFVDVRIPSEPKHLGIGGPGDNIFWGLAKPLFQRNPGFG